MENVYRSDDCIIFKKNKDAFGDLSNMATNYSLVVNDIPIKTVEALYQLCRFPHRIDIQEEIIKCPSPMTVKIKSRKYRKYSREGWDAIREDIMWWCLRIKLVQHLEQFGAVLESTGDQIIVEESHRDVFWGAVRNKEDPNILKGENIVGLQLMKLRELYREKDTQKLSIVEPLDIPQFTIYGNAIQIVKV